MTLSKLSSITSSFEGSLSIVSSNVSTHCFLADGTSWSSKLLCFFPKLSIVLHVLDIDTKEDLLESAGVLVVSDKSENECMALVVDISAATEDVFDVNEEENDLLESVEVTASDKSEKAFECMIPVVDIEGKPLSIDCVLDEENDLLESVEVAASDKSEKAFECMILVEGIEGKAPSIDCVLDMDIEENDLLESVEVLAGDKSQRAFDGTIPVVDIEDEPVTE